MTDIILTIREATAAQAMLRGMMRQKLPAKAQYRASKALRKLDQELRTFEEQREEMIREAGLFDELGRVRPKLRGSERTEWADAIEAIDNRLEQLGEEKVTLTGIHPIEISLLDEHDISGDVMYAAPWLFIEEEIP